MLNARNWATLVGSLWIPLALFGCRSTAATDPSAFDVEWIYSPEGKAFDDLPPHAWRRDGRALLWDATHEPPTFELLLPETGMRSMFVDPERALASLRELLPNRADLALRWPDVLDQDGNQGLYAIDGDLFLLDLASSTFVRLTETQAEETSASFSPDGRRVAFVRENDLFAADVSGAREVRLTRDGSATTLNGTLSWVYWEELFGRRDVGYWWSDDSRSIAYLQSDESEVGTVTFPRFEEPYAEPVVQRYPKAGSANPRVRLGVVQVSAEQPTTSWIDVPEDTEYIARVQWLPDSRQVSVQTLTRDQRRLDLSIADAATGRGRVVLTETDEAWVNVHDDLYFLEDGRRFLWVSERSGYAHLYLYGIDGTLLQPITQGNWAMASSGGGVFWLRQAVCAVDEERGWIYYTSQEASSLERHLYRVRFDGTERERLTREHGTHGISFSPSGSHYLDAYSRLGSPPRLSLVNTEDPEGAEVLPLAHPDRRGPAGSELALRVPEWVRVPARDGFELPGWILKPANFNPNRRYPLIFYVYGGPSAPTVTDAWDDDLLFDQLLSDAGFLVARCDNRSSTGISKRLESTTLLRSIGDVERDDYVDAIRWFKALPYVDAERVGIWGWSGGGSMTLLMMTRSEEFKAGIAVAPVTDWRYYDTKWAEFMMKRPQDNPEGYAYTSLVERAADLSGHLLLVHGTYDDNVHPQNAWAFIDRLVDAGIDFEMMMYPMRKHGISDRAARVHLFKKMLAFWKTHLQ